MSDDLISRQAVIDALDVLRQEHRYKIQGKEETYSQYNEAWQDALDRAEGVIGNLPSAHAHAHWVGLRGGLVPLNEFGVPIELAFCSNCDMMLVGSDEYETIGRYCPNCGAKMDEEKIQNAPF